MLIPTILCGGAGSRLWPVSRDLHPKPFIRLAGEHSLLQETFLRARSIPNTAEILTITNRELSFKTKDEYAALLEAATLQNTYLLEPVVRNTAAAIAAACHYVHAKYGGEASLLILPADHLISDPIAFANAVNIATEFAAEDRIVTFGITPERPETGYGYIEAEGHRVIRFVEKPDAATAAAYVKSGRFLWNAGIFCFRAQTMLNEMARHCPDLLPGSAQSLKDAQIMQGELSCQIELARDAYAALPEISIDYAVMEKSSRIAVVPCSIGWSDIGSWSAISDLTPADGLGNRIQGTAVLHDSSGCFVRSEEQRVIGLVGTRNLVIVDTPDALLIADSTRTQDVRSIHAQLKATGHEAHRTHRTAHRPWGTYTVIEEGNRFKIKRIVVTPGASLSLQMHHHRSEHWIVVSGTAEVTNEDAQFMLHTDQSTYIPAGNKHRLKNPGLIDLVMIEVQSGEYLEEDDIVRFSDVYGRELASAPQHPS